HDQPENSNELVQKHLEDLKELAEYKESLENSSKDIDASNSNEEKEGPPQDFYIHQLIREECSVEVSEEQKQKIEDTIVELVKICRQKEFLCIHDNVEDLIESALNTKLLSINSQRLDNKEHSISLNNTSQISPVHAVSPILSTKETEYSPSMGYGHSTTSPKTESDEIMKSGVKELIPILSENEVTLEDKKECDLPVSEISPICDDHSKIFYDSKNDDDISVYDDFEDVEYVEASLSDPKIVSEEEENVVQQEEEEVDLEDISQIQDIFLREKLLSITLLIYNIKSLNENPIPNYVLNSFESGNSLSNNFSQEFETLCDHTEETRSGNTTHADDSLPKEDDLFLSDNSIQPGIENSADDLEGDIYFLEELLIDDSFLSHESSDSNFEDNPSVPGPPPELPDFENIAGEEIPVVMNDKDKFDEDYYFFMFDRCFLFSPLRVRIPSLTLNLPPSD
nr:hypothetical protein [Tanacetum cinerariifolium]